MRTVETKIIRVVRPRVQDRIKSRLDSNLDAAHEIIKAGLLRKIAASPLERSFLFDANEFASESERAGIAQISRFEILTYANSLVTKHLASKAGLEGELVKIEMSDRGLRIFKNIASKTVAEDHKPSTIPVEDGSSEIASVRLGASAVSLLRPILRHACTQTMTLSQMVTKLALEFNTPAGDAERPVFEGNHSLATLTQHGVTYLTSKGFLVSNGKLFAGTPKARQGILDGHFQAWEGFVEPAPIIPVVTKTEIAKPRRKLDVNQVIGLLPSMAMPKTMALWQNATRIAADDTKAQSRSEALTIIDAVHKEWKRRSSSLRGETFRWPGTEVNATSERGEFPALDIQAEGILGFMDYRVGRTKGQTEGHRRSVLAFAFLKSLPPAFDPEYMAQWGANGSAQRLRKISSSIAAFCRNAKRRDDADLSLAIDHWEADLRFLHKHFYRDNFDFKWPKTHGVEVQFGQTSEVIGRVPTWQSPAPRL